ncbi:MAG: nitrogenase iron-molybdenum cofactor biosynthesis protein NifN [Candidatus Competibacteraceae bacterium]|nr:nitrogenase iron-molybdenum cofactor biosynthesis protein NifN [Candidatus Competibacteraceae bacterium]
MAELLHRSKPLAVSPLKTSQPLGASLAVLGLNRAMPLLHGAQGCTAFAKVFLVRHFREPIPLQSTAMDPINSVMGADDNVIAALKTIAEKNRPAAIGLLTTGLSEAQGTDIHRMLKTFRARYPEFQAVRIVAVNTPDFDGCLESGFALAVKAMIEAWVPPAGEATTRPGRRAHQINVLCGSLLTPGDLESLRELIERFGLNPVLIPDLADSLDGHLDAEDFSPVTTGGAPLSAFATLGDAAATLVVGPSLHAAADLLEQRTGVPSHRFDHLFGLDVTDRLVATLADISGRSVPARLERQRAQLQDALLDTHFLLGQARVAVAADPDLLHALVALLAETGAEVVAAVASSRAAVLSRTPLPQIRIGDLEDLEDLARERGAELVISNSHAAETAGRLGMPLLRAGIPQYDRIGGYQRGWIGYAGGRQLLFDLANALLEQAEHGVAPYRSLYSRKSDSRQEAIHGAPQASAHFGWRH